MDEVGRWELVGGGSRGGSRQVHSSEGGIVGSFTVAVRSHLSHTSSRVDPEQAAEDGIEEKHQKGSRG